jgi:glycerol-3-phosphate dehydrogenase
LRERGYGALLIESERLGAGQTICAQGIIHGGAKYACTGRVSRSAEDALPGCRRYGGAA